MRDHVTQPSHSAVALSLSCCWCRVRVSPAAAARPRGAADTREIHGAVLRCRGAEAPAAGPRRGEGAAGCGTWLLTAPGTRPAPTLDMYYLQHTTQRGHSDISGIISEGPF